MDWVKVIVVSAMPFFELRGGIPLAIYLGFSPITAYFLAVTGNFIPIPFLLFFLDRVRSVIERFDRVYAVYLKIVDKIEKRRRIVERYGYIGLTFFVLIPFPATGAWTGSLLAFLLGLNKLKSMIFIFLGITIAGVIVLLTSIGIKSAILL